MNEPTTMHAIERTSPKGGPFVGTCRLCGQSGLTFTNLRDWCPNTRGLTEGEAIIETVKGVVQ